VNHAYERLASDPTRIFRVIYYAVKCDKKIPDYVKKWITELAPNLSKLSFGIFKHHIEKWFYSEHFDKMLTLLVELDILKCLLRFSDDALQHKYASLY
jgi:tRNA nucleotidyltransferase/poly(A) polymerase